MPSARLVVVVGERVARLLFLAVAVDKVAAVVVAAVPVARGRDRRSLSVVELRAHFLVLLHGLQEGLRLGGAVDFPERPLALLVEGLDQKMRGRRVQGDATPANGRSGDAATGTELLLKRVGPLWVRRAFIDPVEHLEAVVTAVRAVVDEGPRDAWRCEDVLTHFGQRRKILRDHLHLRHLLRFTLGLLVSLVLCLTVRLSHLVLVFLSGVVLGFLHPLVISLGMLGLLLLRFLLRRRSRAALGADHHAILELCRGHHALLRGTVHGAGAVFVERALEPASSWVGPARGVHEDPALVVRLALLLARLLVLDPRVRHEVATQEAKLLVDAILWAALGADQHLIAQLGLRHRDLLRRAVQRAGAVFAGPALEPAVLGIVPCGCVHERAALGPALALLLARVRVLDSREGDDVAVLIRKVLMHAGCIRRRRQLRGRSLGGLHLAQAVAARRLFACAIALE